MESFDILIEYAGSEIEAVIGYEEIYTGSIYPVEMGGRYAFTLVTTDENEWSVMREPDGTTPVIEKELYDSILKKLKYQLRYAA